MLAKQAKKIIDEHLDEGKVTEASKSIISDVVVAAKEAGYKGPFNVKKVAICSPEVENYGKEEEVEKTEDTE